MEPFVGEIRLFAFDRTPQGWFPCDGRVLQIVQFQALYALLGVAYGGNGSTTFAIPDLRGSVPVHPDASITRGQKAGDAAHTLIATEMPTHTHIAYGSSDAPNTNSPVDSAWANSANYTMYSNSAADTTLSPQAISASGGSQPHNNMQPYLTLQYCIAYNGIFPSRP
ncbi:tail Collar domain-containing protein [Paenibacillus montaniterrae]|uniref:Tail Collar domain-containing protein n=1 Tax=Paenibacillus montaniterrae TaxID=429341 RepID=A0A919YRA8_9BACL|nr:tail fiber protein [Paenibacillus montaniterrae]GIP15911.1 tail Collar domain-containing protein [Paenibacillus montaniterrae]